MDAIIWLFVLHLPLALQSVHINTKIYDSMPSTQLPYIRVKYLADNFVRIFILWRNYVRVKYLADNFVRIFILHSAGFKVKPTPLVHCSTDSLTIITNYVAPIAKSNMYSCLPLVRLPHLQWKCAFISGWLLLSSSI
jgi:hypothetical protein